MNDYEIYFSTDNNETDEMVWDTITFTDAIKMADNAWKAGASFDVEDNILINAVTSTPVKIIQSDNVKIEDQEMYVLWGVIEVAGCDFEVPIRFYAHRKEFDEKKFKWKTFEPKRSMDLESYVEAIENEEKMKWESILDGS